MNKEGILVNLFKSEDFNLMLRKLMSQDDIYFDDFKQDLFIILMDAKEQFIVDLHEGNQLNFWITRIILNQVKSKSSPFYTTYKKRRPLYIEELKDIEYKIDTNKCFDVLKYCSEHKILTWYEYNILSIYYKLGDNKHHNNKVSLRSIEKEYGIDHVSLHLTIEEAKRKIKESLFSKKIIYE